MHKRVGDIEEFQFYKLPTDTETGDVHLHITIVISGWLNDEKESSYIQPWKYLRVYKTIYFILILEYCTLLKISWLSFYVQF